MGEPAWLTAVSSIALLAIHTLEVVYNSRILASRTKERVSNVKCGRYPRDHPFIR